MPKYNSIDTIPAKVFFQILENKNYQLLKPKPREKELEQVFLSIYDDWFLQSENPNAKEYLRISNEMIALTNKINTVKQILYFIFYNKTTQKMRYDIIDALALHCNIFLDKSKPFLNEMNDVLRIQVGELEIDLEMLKTKRDDLKPTNADVEQVFSYYKQITGFENVLKRNINDDIVLAKYIEYERSAITIFERSQLAS